MTRYLILKLLYLQDRDCNECIWKIYGCCNHFLIDTFAVASVTTGFDQNTVTLAHTDVAQNVFRFPTSTVPICADIIRKFSIIAYWCHCLLILI